MGKLYFLAFYTSWSLLDETVIAFDIWVQRQLKTLYLLCHSPKMNFDIDGESGIALFFDDIRGFGQN